MINNQLASCSRESARSAVECGNDCATTSTAAAPPEVPNVPEGDLNLQFVSDDSRTSLEDGLERFKDYQHPIAKIIVSCVAVATLVCLIRNAVKIIPVKFSHLMCFSSHNIACSNFRILDFLDLIAQITFELIHPSLMLISFAFTTIAYSLLPKLSTYCVNPVTSMSILVLLAITNRVISCFSASMALMATLATTTNIKIWEQYISETFFGLMWMFALMNMQAFSRLCTYNTIRAREKFSEQEINNAVQP